MEQIFYRKREKHPNGRTKVSTPFKRGLKHGNQIHYNQDGVRVKVIRFLDGELVGELYKREGVRC